MKQNRYTVDRVVAKLHQADVELGQDKYDHLTDRTEDGRLLKLLAVIDEYTRECLVLKVARPYTATNVIATLQYLFAVRGRPSTFAATTGRGLLPKGFVVGYNKQKFSRCSSPRAAPGENGYVECFNDKLRDERLNRELFLSLDNAPWIADRWRLHYNHR